MLKALYEAIRRDAAPTTLEIDGRTYASDSLAPVRTPTPEPLTVKTLSAIEDYLRTNVDGLDSEKLICHVESPESVAILSALQGSFDDRKTYIRAKLDKVKLPLGEWMDAEAFIIAVQACFTESEQDIQPSGRGLVLKYTSSVKTTLENAVTDDGVSQAVTVRKGIAGAENTILPNPVSLRPFRTFTEVEQPASSFVFRVKDDHGSMKFSLTEADGGAWRAEAMKSIKSWLLDHIPGLNVIA